MDYIKLSRKLMEWEWYGNINTCRLFVHMLLKANWKDGRFEGNIIPRGSFVSSIQKLADETSLTIRETRTAISHLKMTGEVTSKVYAKYTVFTINNYCQYQTSDMQNDMQATCKRHSNDILTTTIEEKKEYKEGKNIIPPISPLTMFEDFWKAYPRDGNKQTAEYNYCRLFVNDCNLSEDDLVKAAENYAEFVKILGRTGDFVTKPENFLKNNYFVDFLPGQYKRPDKPREKNRFNDFEQREMSKEDFANLEEELLSYGFEE